MLYRKNKKIEKHKPKRSPNPRARAKITGVGAALELTKDPRRSVAVAQVRMPSGAKGWHIQFKKPKTGKSVKRGRLLPTCRTRKKGNKIITTLQLSNEAISLLSDALDKLRAQEAIK
jgi:ribosomal protein L2